MTRKSTPHRPVRLNLEALESRLTPDATSYVNGLYAEVLNRAPTQAERDFWVGQVQHVGTSQVASAFWLSSEHRGLEVDQYYQTYLHRGESAADRQFWVNRFTNGGLSEVQVQIAFLTSAEYMNNHPGASNYVEALYNDVLGRASDPNGKTFWTQQLQGGASPASVALGFLSSAEGQGRAVEQLYGSVLNRTSDTNGRNFWVGQLQDDDPGDTDDFNSYTEPGNNDGDNSRYLDNLDRFISGLGDREASREEIAVNFLTSQEFVNAH